MAQPSNEKKVFPLDALLSSCHPNGNSGRPKIASNSAMCFTGFPLNPWGRIAYDLLKIGEIL